MIGVTFGFGLVGVVVIIVHGSTFAVVAVIVGRATARGEQGRSGSQQESCCKQGEFRLLHDWVAICVQFKGCGWPFCRPSPMDVHSADATDLQQVTPRLYKECWQFLHASQSDDRSTSKTIRILVQRMAFLHVHPSEYRRQSEDAPRLQVGKRLLVCSTSAHAVWVFLLAYMELWPIMWLSIATLPAYGVSAYFMRVQTLNIAVLIHILTMQIFVFVASGLMGCQGQTDVMLACTTGLSFILLDLDRNRRLALAFSLLSLVLYMVLQFVDVQVIFWTADEQATIIPVLRMASVVTVIALLLSQLYCVVTISKRYQHQLREASSTLRKEAEAKQDFLAHISHELRTPLNAINGLSHLMLREPHQEDTERLEAIKHACKHMLGLINDILDFSKIENQGLDPQPVEIIMRDFSERIIQQFAPQADAKGVHLDVLCLDGEVAVYIDEKYLEQIVNNLISNALKFTDTGSVSVQLQTTFSSGSEGALTITVADSGCGIPGEQQERIFKAFDQGSRAKSIRYGGTGLGLPISRQIAENLGGTLELKSSRRGETIFECRLPCTRIKVPTKKDEGLEIQVVDFAGGHVLVVDDNALNRMVIEQYLKVQGLTVTLAEDGIQALEMGEKQEFDLILMDLRMPGMDGFEASRALRKIGCNTPIVALSATSYSQIADRLKYSGFDDFEMKPFNPGSLLLKLQRYISQQVDG